MNVVADAALIRNVLDNLVGNAWKCTARTPLPRIAVGCETQQGGRVFFVRDNGAGFDMGHAERPFGAFQRLHGRKESVGTGIGLTIVPRVRASPRGPHPGRGACGQGSDLLLHSAVIAPVPTETGKRRSPSGDSRIP